jgi:succinate dehydrogenase / fumarate reductase cytochrome b subunit
MEALKPTRPVFLNVLRLRYPVGAVASIGHRISGVVLVIFTPILIYLFEASLRNAEDYARIAALLDSTPARGAALVVLWAFAHHFLAGLRHLLMDVDLGSSLPAARRSAWVVNAASVAVVLLAARLLS